MAKRDRLYETVITEPGDFVFDDRVVSVFPDMINRSVPGYGTIVPMTGMLARRYAQPDSRLYDLGCSLGAVSLAMQSAVRMPGTRIIMGILDLGAASKFHYLGNRDQMIVVDIHLFLADQMRFEMMRRLGWIKIFEGGKYCLLNMVQDFDKVKTKCRQHPPLLVESNPAYTAYTQLTIGDKEVFIRRMLQEALDAFKERL